MTTASARGQVTSDRLFAQAVDLLPGGVSSPVRAFRAVGGQPLFIQRGEGAYIEDVDGNRYIDYVGSWGPMILGHAEPSVVQAIQQAAARGSSFGAPSPGEVELAQAIRGVMPHLEMLRFVNSGTEATMSALRVARAATGRDKILKFDGCYHGHADALLTQAGSGLATLGIPDSPGVPAAVTAGTVSVPYNDLDAVKAAFEKYPQEIAAVIVEPIAANMGVVPPAAGFLEGLRAICDQDGALLIFDEVISGFRVARSGVRERCGVTADLTCLGKIVGGGLPVGVYGGRRDLMSLVAPSGSVYQAGTLSGNPLAMAAGVATLRKLEDPAVYRHLEAAGERLEAGVNEAIRRVGVNAYVSRVGSLLTLFFTKGPVRNYAEASGSNRQAFAAFHGAMLREQVYLPPSQFEAWFISNAHGDAEIETTIAVAYTALKSI